MSNNKLLMPWSIYKYGWRAIEFSSKIIIADIYVFSDGSAHSLYFTNASNIVAQHRNYEHSTMEEVISIAEAILREHGYEFCPPERMERLMLLT